MEADDPFAAWALACRDDGEEPPQAAAADIVAPLPERDELGGVAVVPFVARGHELPLTFADMRREWHEHVAPLTDLAMAPGCSP